MFYGHFLNQKTEIDANYSILIQMPICEQRFQQMASQRFDQNAVIITKNIITKTLNL